MDRGGVGLVGPGTGMVEGLMVDALLTIAAGAGSKFT